MRISIVAHSQMLMRLSNTNWSAAIQFKLLEMKPSTSKRLHQALNRGQFYPPATIHIDVQMAYARVWRPGGPGVLSALGTWPTPSQRVRSCHPAFTDRLGQVQF